MNRNYNDQRHVSDLLDDDHLDGEVFYSVLEIDSIQIC